MAKVVIALGANVGDALANMQQAIDLLGLHVALEKVSRVYRTAPMYVADQPDFLNAAVLGTTDLGPLALLDALKSIEHKVGRLFRERFGPREVDLDVILYGSLHYRYFPTAQGVAKLEIPHARAHERGFVLAPMADLDPDLVIPGQGRVSDLLGEFYTHKATNWAPESVLGIADAVLSIRSR
ncbi:MAG: 2-amino-4-hydroxy-6-hydroxymethyldihydropteridine diphosphokinase [Fimbriimonas sp.]